MTSAAVPLPLQSNSSMETEDKSPDNLINAEESREDDWIDVMDMARLHPLTVYTEHLADKVGIIDAFQRNRIGRWVTGLTTRAHTVLDATEQDIDQSNTPTTDRWVRRSAIYSQLADRARLVMILASNAAIDAFDWSKDGRWAGAAAAGIFMGWSALIGESLNQTYKRMPHTVTAIQEEFPVAVDLMADALPGSRKKEESQESELIENSINDLNVDSYEADELSFVAKSWQKVRTAGNSRTAKIMALPVSVPLNLVRRGFSAVNFGATAYVSTTTFQNGTEKDNRKQTGDVMLYGGAFCFGLGWAVCERIENLTEDGKYEQAQDLLDFVSNDMNWLKLGALSIAVELGLANLRARKLRRDGLITANNESSI